ncbi:MAG: VIT1/CCC1 transporter family protein [Candidatus Micrarchaeota archaeon]
MASPICGNVSFERQRCRHDQLEGRGMRGALLRQLILGGQDGIVNVLGIILGVATATGSVKLVLVTAVAATLAESISMAAVAYTSTKAQKTYYAAQVKREEFEILHFPCVEREEIRKIYRAKGFRGRTLDAIVRHITSNRKRWVDEMMLGELKLTQTDFDSPATEAVVVGISALVGSLVPIVPFFLTASVWTGAAAAIALSAVVLFATGAFRARETVGDWRKGGLEMAGVGVIAAVAGYVIGLLLGVVA